MRHFLFEKKEYRISPYFKRRRNGQDSAVALARLLRRLASGTRSGSGTRGGGGKRGADARQKCIAKMQYSNSGIAHSRQLEEYLVREGTGIDGGRAKLYGTDLDEYRENMVDKNFRIFLSPQSDKINLKDLTEKFMETLEQRTGYKIYWQAANHYNTAHPHAHILINGKDQNGRKIKEIPRDIVRTFMREYARDICTSQIGNRTAGEIALEKERELEAQRFTRLDESLKDLCGGNFAVYPNQIYSNRERLLARIENLRKMGLCSYKDGAYRFSPQWEDDLRANGRYNAFLKARAELKYADQANLKVFSGADGIITGRVTKIYAPDDDFSNNHAAVIECQDGKAYFVPLLKAPEMIAKAGNGGTERTKLKEGELVRINTYQTQSGRLTPVIFKAGGGEIKQARKEIKTGFAKLF